VGEIDQRVVLAVKNPVDDQLLPDQRAPIIEDFLSVLAEIDIADLNRPGLPAGNRGIGWILEPIPFLQAIDKAALKIGRLCTT